MLLQKNIQGKDTKSVKEGKEMNINKIIEELKNKDIINHSIVYFKSLDGGTTSQVFVLYEDDLPAYVLKLNDEVTIVTAKLKWTVSAR